MNRKIIHCKGYLSIKVGGWENYIPTQKIPPLVIPFSMVGRVGKLHTFFINEKGRTGGFNSPPSIEKNTTFGDTFFYGGEGGNRTHIAGFSDRCRDRLGYRPIWSEKRGSNPRPPPWQGGALPLSYSRKYHNIISIKSIRNISNFVAKKKCGER